MTAAASNGRAAAMHLARAAVARPGRNDCQGEGCGDLRWPTAWLQVPLTPERAERLAAVTSRTGAEPQDWAIAALDRALEETDRQERERGSGSSCQSLEHLGGQGRSECEGATS